MNQTRTLLADIFKSELSIFNNNEKKKEKKSKSKKKNFDVLNRTHIKFNNKQAEVWNEVKQTNHLQKMVYNQKK